MTKDHHDPRRYLAAPDGSADFGTIPDDVAAQLGVAAGPIRLEFGIPGSSGFGYRHVQENEARARSFPGLGYPSFLEFAAAVARHYQRIGEGGRPGRLALVFRHLGYDLQLIVQHNTGGCWTITTGLPYRVARCRMLWERQVDEREPSSDAPEPRRRFETLSLPRKPRDSGS